MVLQLNKSYNASQSLPAMTTEQKIMRQATQKVNLLLVDDRPENLLALEAILEPLGQNLVKATSGAEALKCLLSDDFALILMDVQMPGMDGFETARLIKERQRSRHIPIIFVTAISKEERYVFDGYSAGAVDYLRKPFEPDILQSKVAVFIELFQKSEQIKEQAERLRQSEQREAERQQVERERTLELRFLRELAESEARLSGIISAAMDAIITVDEQQRIITFNAAAERMFGYTVDEILGQPLFRLLPQRFYDAHAGHVLNFGASGATSRSMGILNALLGKRKCGQEFPLEATISKVVVGGQQLYTAIVRDITERTQAEEALAIAFEREKRIAETLQRSLLLAPPKDAFPGLTVATFYAAAWKEASIGGDFFDVFSLNEGRVALVEGDVSGKGLEAAARTAEIKYALRAYLREDAHPGRALARLNNFLCDTKRLDRQASETLVVVSLTVIDAATGNAVCSLAGAEPPLVLRVGGEAETAEAAGLPLGVEPDVPYATATLCLGPGDTLLMATDGITEARRGQSDFLGYEGMMKLAQQALTAASLDEMGQTILEGAQAFTGGALQDDACLLLVRRSQPGLA